jgi:phospholipase C
MLAPMKLRLVVACSMLACFGCSQSHPDRYAPLRQACTFGPGARVQDTVGLDAAARAAIPIKHVIVLMKENRSFDHMLGKLHDRGQPAVEAIASDFQNEDVTQTKVFPFHAPTTCWQQDPDHQWSGMLLQVDDGLMDGFVKSAAASTTTDGHFVMSFHDESDLPFYYWLARTFALNDRHFPSVRSGTFPNRDYLLLGTSDGVMSTGGGFPQASTPTIFDRMDQAGVSWGVYSDGGLLSEALNWDYTHKNTGHFADFMRLLDGDGLPQVVFVDGVDNVEDEHPTADVQKGEDWTRNIYEHALASKYWRELAMIWTYDEAGGFADHVPPPEQFCVARPQDAQYHAGGVRVPLAVVSPWARPHYVSHVVQDHTAITRFIEALFDLPALTARDANADALLDLFDFGKPALLNPPTAPAAGTGGCTDVLRLSLDKPQYRAGDPIVVRFDNAPGSNPKDKIALFTYGASGPTMPSADNVLAWAYVGGGQTATTAAKSGQVTLDMSKLGHGTWPLAPGGYIVYYLPNDGWIASASKDLTVN